MAAPVPPLGALPAALPHLTLERLCGGEVLLAGLDRPARLNALNPTLVTSLHALLDALAGCATTRVLVLHGHGRGFCSGFDMRAGVDMEEQATLPAQQRFSALIAKLRRIPQPVVAAVTGAAAGGGFSLALAADVRVAGESARFSCAFARLGLGGCEMGSSFFLPRLVGQALASELALTGRTLAAPEALAARLVSTVVPDSDALAEAVRVAEAMLRLSPAGLRATKEQLTAEQDGQPLHTALAMEDRAQVLLLRLPEVREHIFALAAKMAAGARL